MATVRLSSRVQQILFACELQGQISDGMWENSRPHDHWKVISSANVVVDAANPGLDFRTQRRYNFASAQLIEIVGDRMIQSAQAAIYFPAASPEAIDVLDYGDWMFDPKDFPRFKDKLAEFGVSTKEELAALKLKLREVSYTPKDLRRDLREISKIVNQN